MQPPADRCNSWRASRLVRLTVLYEHFRYWSSTEKLVRGATRWPCHASAIRSELYRYQQISPLEPRSRVFAKAEIGHETYRRFMPPRLAFTDSFPRCLFSTSSKQRRTFFPKKFGQVSDDISAYLCSLPRPFDFQRSNDGK